MIFTKDIKDFPVWMMFCVFPFISLASWASGKGEVNYDPFYIGMTAFLLLRIFFTGTVRLQKRHVFFLSALAALVFLKYVVPWIYIDRLSLKASLMDGKWVCFVVFAVLWVNRCCLP